MKKHFTIIFTSCLTLLIIVIPLLAIACGPDGATPQDADNRRSDACELNVFQTPQNTMASFSRSPGPQKGINGYECGTMVTVEAITYGPSLAIDRPEYVFDHWSGDVPAGKDRDNPLTITMDRDKTINAHFRSNICTLSVSYTPQNAMPAFIYSPDPHWVNHGYDCGTTVTVEAITYGPPLTIGRPEYVFDRWSGDVPAGKERDNPLTITMDSDKTITAHFMENPARDAPPPEKTLSVDFTISVQCQSSQSGCTCTVNYAVNAEDLSSGDKYPVTNVKLEVNDGTGWREWHNSGGISLPYYHHPDKETGVACGKTFSVRATATNSIGQTVTSTGSLTTPIP